MNIDLRNEKYLIKRNMFNEPNILKEITDIKDSIKNLQDTLDNKILSESYYILIPSKQFIKMFLTNKNDS